MIHHSLIFSCSQFFYPRIFSLSDESLTTICIFSQSFFPQEFGETIETTRAQAGTAAAADLYKTGFITNTKRGTAYFYSEEAVRRFLELNGLSHVIRAHEVCAQGFEIKHKGKTITVFSSSRYGNGNNEAAVCFVDKNKIRPVKVDTMTTPPT